MGTRYPDRRPDEDALGLNQFALAVDEYALNLRRLLGPRLDAHGDPRGILFVPDAWEPKGAGCDTLVREVSGGFWVPKVDANYIPVRYTSAPAGTHEALVLQAINVMGRDAALTLDMVVRIELTNGRADVFDSDRDRIQQLTRLMGPEFASLYEKSVRKKVDEELAEIAVAKARFNESEAKWSVSLGTDGTAPKDKN
jgi:hypothetical protein